MDIYLIRHGSTAGNLEHRYVGTTDEPLTEDAARRLTKNRESYPRADCVFASPLRRCTQTAQLLYPEAVPQLLPELRECGFGSFEYKNYEELKDDPRYQAWIDSGGTLAFPGGESRRDFCDRCCASFEKACSLAQEQGAQRAAFVVHGGTIMAVLDRFSRPHRDYFTWQVKNGEGFACTLQPEGNSLCLADIRPLPQAPGMTGIEDQFVMKQKKRLRCGYTTGSCAAAAAKAAAQMLLSGRICWHADLLTPKGIHLHLPVEEQRIAADYASCAVRKYAGDDPDATDGILVAARAEYFPEETMQAVPQQGAEAVSGLQQDRKNFSQTGRAFADSTDGRVWIDGGVGVGRVTRPGLEQPVGAAAINRVPREMIAREVGSVCEEYEYPGRIKIIISVPQGEAIAQKTFNPHIGIQGGISILGTSGIVVPMSEEALIASIRVEMKQKFLNGERYILITPGNYGADFIGRQELSQALDAKNSMKCSNYVGETLDIAAELGVKGILFVAHIGKFIKVSGGVMNTHSAHADCRAELIAAQAMRAGAPADVVRRLLDTNTTEEAVSILQDAGCLEQTVAEVTGRIKFHLQKHCRGELETEAVIFSNQYGYLGQTDGADAMMERIAAFQTGVCKNPEGSL